MMKEKSYLFSTALDNQDMNFVKRRVLTMFNTIGPLEAKFVNITCDLLNPGLGYYDGYIFFPQAFEQDFIGTTSKYLISIQDNEPDNLQVTIEIHERKNWQKPLSFYVSGLLDGPDIDHSSYPDGLPISFTSRNNKVVIDLASLGIFTSNYIQTVLSGFELDKDYYGTQYYHLSYLTDNHSCVIKEI